MRLPATIAISKLALGLNRLTGSGGTALPGLVAQKLQPGILAELAARNFPQGIIVVTGTNGKTTTSKMISDILSRAGVSHIHNKAGSNLERGIIATILQQSDAHGRCDAQMAIFEVDEAFVPSVCAQLQPKMVVITNLFRDQLDRYGELDSIAHKFADTLRQLDCQIILNADDPLVASLGKQVDPKRVSYFGISDYIGPKIENDHAQDSIFSPNTGEELQYSQRYFGHMGIYTSKDKSFTRPRPNFELTKMIKNSESESIFDVKTPTLSAQYHLLLPGIYNMYNALAAIAVATLSDISLEITQESLAQTTAAFGRVEDIEYGGRRFSLLLIKNPTGFNQTIQTYLKHNQKGFLWLIINDNFADGRDVSWLWDSALEDISGYGGKILVSGTRAYDMALRLQYANISTAVVEPDMQKALQVACKQTTSKEQIRVLPTYTAMLELRKTLVKQSSAKEFWE